MSVSGESQKKNSSILSDSIGSKNVLTIHAVFFIRDTFIRDTSCILERNKGRFMPQTSVLLGFKGHFLN